MTTIASGEPVGSHPEPGMSLRDWFAGQALIGISCNDNAIASLSWRADPHANRARLAYDIADAMLAARQNGGDA